QDGEGCQRGQAISGRSRLKNVQIDEEGSGRALPSLFPFLPPGPPDPGKPFAPSIYLLKNL
ncbi:MAG: hypothetical protein ABFD62_18450, partial [Syntrophaceae bacterium]